MTTCVARLVVLIVANALLRIAGGASGILVGLYLSDAASRGFAVDAGLVGVIGAVSFGAELLASLPMGILSDAISPRWLMTIGALLGAGATQLFGMTGRAAIFGLSRGLEGLGAAAGGPALLAHLTDTTDGQPARCAKVMSFYELAFLAGIALGGVLGSQLWRMLQSSAFAAVAGIYVACAILLYFGAVDNRAYGSKAAVAGLGDAFRSPSLRRLAPVWLCVNTIVGLWLGPTLTFLFTQPTHHGQFLSGIFATAPERIGWVMLWYALVFGIGVTAWSFVMPRIGAERTLTIGLAAMPFVCAGLYLLNHSMGVGEPVRWVIGGVTAVLIMIESGFTPAALSLLAGAIGAHPGERFSYGNLLGFAQRRRNRRFADGGLAGSNVFSRWPDLRDIRIGPGRLVVSPTHGEGTNGMSEKQYDLVIIGAGSGGLTAAGFAARLGAKVALVEKSRIGGDCTWTGCVPSKALLKAAKVAHEVRSAAHYGITAGTPVTDMRRVRDYVRGAIQQVYQFEQPEELAREGIDIVIGAARFLDENTIDANGQRISAKSFLITTGAHPSIPAVAGLSEVPYLTYEQIFDNDNLPATMIVIGGGPIGMEMAQAYQRLGSQVTVVAEKLLPKEEPEVREVMQRVFEREGIRFVWGRALSARKDDNGIGIRVADEDVRGDLLLVASGRRPTVAGLDLEKAGVVYSERGIVIDSRLRTNVKHIYAAGDVTGGYQFTHFAGWQAFQAVRNAMLPGSSSGLTDLVPWVTFTDPEVAHVGLTEAKAKEKYSDAVEVLRRKMSRTDRAVCENDTDGFIKLITRKDGTILGATIVAGRAGEAITEVVVAIKQGLKAADLAGAIHAYPTYSTAVQQMAADAAVESMLSGVSGTVIRGLSSILR